MRVPTIQLLIEDILAATAADASAHEREIGALAAQRLLAMLDDLEWAGTHRNGGLAYRPVGLRGEPYPEWLQTLRGSSGVYVIRDLASKDVLYVGESHTGRVYETLTRHFQEWRRWKNWWRDQFSEGHDPGLTYPRDRVEVAVRTTPANRAIDEEARLIRRLRPRDNLLGQPGEEAVPF